MAIIKDKNLLEDGNISIKLINKCIDNHKSLLERYNNLNDYYEGKHKILSRTLSTESLPNNRIIANHAEYISDMAVGYVFGTPIIYSGDESVDLLNNIFTGIDEDSHNNELALDISILGTSYELVYMNDDDEPTIELATLSPMNTFVVADNSVKEIPLFAVSYYEKRDIEDTLTGYYVEVYTESEILTYLYKDLTDLNPELIEVKEHFFKGIPIIEYKNNKKASGDFEGVITLIDAYNLLQSDRLNDKEQLVDAFLAIIGASLGDDLNEKVETAKTLKELKIIELDQGGDAKWLVKTLNETEIEVLKKSLKDDIHEFSKVPCLTDENFASNSSGIAMKYKLLGFEQLAKIKERYFKKGLRQRLKLISNLESTRASSFDYKLIDIIMNRSLPEDGEALIKQANETEGLLSWETRISRYDPEIDMAQEKKRIEAEKKRTLEEQQKAFGSYEYKNLDEKDLENE